MGANPSKPDPSVRMQVIGAGYSRTGTSSVAMALEKLLGGPVSHNATQAVKGADEMFLEKWAQAVEAKQAGNRELALKRLREVTSGYVGCTDMPIGLVIPELVDLYLEAKFVLVTRDPERWWLSYETSLQQIPWYVGFLTLPLPRIRCLARFMRSYHKGTADLWERAGKPPGQYTSELLTVYNQMVVDTVPKERLLVMDIKDGWEPLCKFLEKPIPAEPFPLTNDAAAFEAEIKSLFVQALVRWLGVLIIVGGTTFAMYRMTQSRW